MSKVLIYTKYYCPYCVRAKELFDEKGIVYTEIDIEKNPDKRPEMIEKANGASTVPQVFINGKHIGGCDDTLELDRSGKLDELLNN